jgi:hypothetical protein
LSYPKARSDSLAIRVWQFVTAPNLTKKTYTICLHPGPNKFP